MNAEKEEMMINDKDLDKLVTDSVYDMLYGGHMQMDFNDFLNIVKLAYESECVEEFIIKCDASGFENDILRKYIIEKVFNGKE